MKKGLGAALVIVLFLLAAVGTPDAATLHYAPVVSSTGDQIAYVKREFRYSASGGSLIPFMGEPTRVKVKSDLIQLCVRNLKTGRITIAKEWKPNLVKKDGRLHIKPVLNWELEQLRYVISIRSEENPGIGIYRRPYAYLTNLESWERLEQGPAAAGTVRVGLSEGPELGRFPRDNEVLIEKTWEAEKALPGIRQRLEELAARRLADAQSEAERGRAKSLSDVIVGQPPGRMLEKLVNLLLAESENGCGNCPDIAPVIILFGESAVGPLVQRYDKIPQDTRPAVLSILGEIGSGTALSLVRREIHADNAEVQRQAVVDLGRIKGNRAGEELALLLKDTRLSSPVRVTVLEQLREIPDTDWPSTVLLTALEDPAIFRQLSMILPDFNEIPERLIWKQLSGIYPYLRSENPDAVLAAQHLVARIRFWNHLSELYPVLEDLLKSCYDYGQTVDAEGNFIDNGTRPPGDRVVWGRDLAADILDHIEKTLQDPVDWHRKAWKKASLLTLLFIENLYASRGKQIINRPPVRAVFEVSMRDADGTVRVCDRHVAEAGHAVRLEGGSATAAFSSYDCEGRLDLDRENWRLVFAPLTVRVEKKTFKVPVSIPFGGACEIELGPLEQGAAGIPRLILRHIDQQV